MQACRYQHNVEVIKNTCICKDHFHLILRDDGRLSGMAEAGQFVNVRINKRDDLLLRRPFSIGMLRAEQSLFEIVYRVVGKGTKAMAELKPGDVVDLLGPFGKGFYIPEGGTDCLLVGGGSGVAPLLGLADRLYRNKNHIIALLGFQSLDKVFSEDIFRSYHAEIIVTTDDGSYGLKGFISDHLGKILERQIDRVYLCGPTPMLKAVLPMIKKANIKGEVSLEERMGCGFGVCMSCAATVLEEGVIEKQRVCTEGPVFDLERVLLDDET